MAAVASSAALAKLASPACECADPSKAWTSRAMVQLSLFMLAAPSDAAASDPFGQIHRYVWWRDGVRKLLPSRHRASGLSFGPIRGPLLLWLTSEADRLPPRTSVARVSWRPCYLRSNSCRMSGIANSAARSRCSRNRVVRFVTLSCLRPRSLPSSFLTESPAKAIWQVCNGYTCDLAHTGLHSFAPKWLLEGADHDWAKDAPT